ncbi:cytochrome P450 monooxygenase 15 [Heterobasidion irregulare TC 32-1]|uniref:Cytochrome P450 monooxygenase 15 n=1 Tax=Heterobasidion irregulare (strain TC 32-1) TaxID=747525 RepID=W4JSG8_HETIT|nr:cytochrome P450 monooxygenase 15 [Heterobasidion irregulare TC 32-1]ETW76399.1 cytochrome P450 monooxygenase 15 [Heterobasidion irregulare TC 32-1]
MSVTVSDCVALLISCVLFKTYLDKRRNPSGLPLPPGPTRLPILGNFLDVPVRTSWETYASWAKRYGDIMSLEVFGETIVVINSMEIARNLLEKRGAIYSDRPAITAYEVMKYDHFITVTRYGRYWKNCRKITDHVLRQSAAMAYRSMQTQKVAEFLAKLVYTPDQVLYHIKHLSASVVMSFTYGLEIADFNDRYVALAETTNIRGTASILPGATHLNTFPFLKHLPTWLPGMSFKKKALIAAEEVQEAINAPFDFAVSEFQKGTAESSFVLRSLELSSETDDTEISDEVIKNTATGIYLAGADTTISILSTFFLVLALHPEIQTRAQAEIDTVVGRERLPEFEDRPRMPYIDAICRELLRWKMVTPLALPHATTEDDIYEGYFIPKVTYRIPCSFTLVRHHSRSILHDPAVYPDPDTFRPERFLAPDGSLVEDPNLISAFGFGRRICPGRFFADASIWTVVSSVLSSFTVRKATDARGNEIPVKGEYSDDRVLCHPYPFKCSIAPRDKWAEGLISQTASKA